MNFLAHAYLSFNDPDILVGNLISDFVKGKKKFDYSPAIQAGIALHRDIDVYTDAHPATKEAKKVFRPVYGLYAAAFVDVVYDHFLAIDPQEFPGQTLLKFTQDVYLSLDAYIFGLPDLFQQLYPFMKEHNWLYNYRHQTGIERSFSSIARRATYISESVNAMRLFRDQYDILAECYHNFFADVKQHAHFNFREYKRTLNSE